MASRGLGTLTLDLVAKIGGFTSALGKAERELNTRSRSIEKRARALGVAIGAALSAAAIAAGYAIKKAIDQADKLNEISQKIGIPTDVLSGLNYAANLAGVATEELQAGLAKMIKFQAEAGAGAKDNVALFKALGIEISDSTGNLRQSADVFGDFAAIFQRLPDGPEKTALALKIFGKAGAELIPLLNEGREGIARYARELAELGGVVTPQAARAADEFNDNVDKLSVAGGGLAQIMAAELLPALVEVTQEVLAFVKDGRSAAIIAKDIGTAFSYTARFIKDAADEYRIFRELYDKEGLIADDFFSNDSGLLAKLEDGRTARLQAEEQQAAMRALGLGSGGGYGGGSPGGRGAGAGRRQGQEDKAAAEAAKAARAAIAGDTTDTNANAEAKRAAAEAARKQAEAERDLAEKLEAADKATADFNAQLEDLVAQQGGPLAESALKYRREEEQIRKLWAEGSAPSAEKLTEALKALHAERDAEAEAIRRQLDTGGQRLEQMENELKLLQMTSQAERDRAAFLLDNPTATGDQADRAAAIQAEIDETRKAIDAADELRDSAKDAFESVLDGSKSAMEGLKDFFNAWASQLQKAAAQWATDGLFGQQGTSGGGLLGGLFGGLFGGGSSSSSNFGVPLPGSGLLPGFAAGTDSAPGGLAVVGERGPEIVRLPRGAQVVPNHELGGSGHNFGATAQVTQNFYQPVDRRTGVQAANDTGRRVSRAVERMA